ncbi:galactosyldiacylglycerol synthase [Actinoallomurus liliacearum]|uniref:Galactosyldiacylglycerol synthase n=1 Tax=Actinoallomurus liliacearum TaxID=1080073 RepID=A0ABP8TUJ6_9ACTN
MLLLSAGMGAGHDAVAGELAGRLTAAGHRADVVDVLELLPLRLGRALRWWYGWMMRRAPWLYALIYRVFFVPGRAGAAPGRRRPASLASSRPASLASPLTVLAAARLRRVLRRHAPDLVVSTFHLAAQAAGHLRRTGRSRAPAVVLLTDFAAHRLWLHPGTDRYLCPCPETAREVAAASGRPAVCHAPLTRPVFRSTRADAAAVHARLGTRPEDRLVLVSAGSWGVGAVEETARVLARSGRYVPVVLCGRNDALRARLGTAEGTVALGWRPDLPELMAAAHALVDNAAGLTCREAFAARLPVVSYRPIPGHGRDGVLAMARAGLSVHAADAERLLAELDRLGDPAARSGPVARAAALFDAPPAEDLLFGPYATPVSDPDGSRSPDRAG